MKIFSVHDMKAEAYLPPIFVKSTGEAMRIFETTCKDTNTNFNKYPHDYTLVELGEWDEQSATFLTSEKPRILANASEYIQ